MRKAILTVAGLVLVIALSAQATDQPSLPLKGMFVTAAQFKALLVGKDMTKQSDSTVHLIDANTANVGVAQVYRPSNPSVNDNYLQHTNVIEIYVVLSGGATMTLGGSLTDAVPFPAAGQEGAAIGPGFRGKGATAGGDTRTIGPGDVVVIPAGVTHYFSKIDNITYLCFRIDPTKHTKLID